MDVAGGLSRIRGGDQPTDLLAMECHLGQGNGSIRLTQTQAASYPGHWLASH